MAESDIDKAINKSLDVFSDYVVTEELYRNRMRQAELEEQIAEMKDIDALLDKRKKKKHQKFFAGATVFFTAQLGFGYHAIYNVPWLGWDIVEPITYTISQGMFIMGMFWLLRMKNLEEIQNKDGGDGAIGNDNNCIWLPNYGLYDPMKKYLLMQELQRVIETIGELEEERIY